MSDQLSLTYQFWWGIAMHTLSWLKEIVRIWILPHNFYPSWPSVLPIPGFDVEMEAVLPLSPACMWKTAFSRWERLVVIKRLLSCIWIVLFCKRYEEFGDYSDTSCSSWHLTSRRSNGFNFNIWCAILEFCMYIKFLFYFVVSFVLCLCTCVNMISRTVWLFKIRFFRILGEMKEVCTLFLFAGTGCWLLVGYFVRVLFDVTESCWFLVFSQINQDLSRLGIILCSFRSVRKTLTAICKWN